MKRVLTLTLVACLAMAAADTKKNSPTAGSKAISSTKWTAVGEMDSDSGQDMNREHWLVMVKAETEAEVMAALSKKLDPIMKGLGFLPSKGRPPVLANLGRLKTSLVYRATPEALPGILKQIVFFGDRSKGRQIVNANAVFLFLSASQFGFDNQGNAETDIYLTTWVTGSAKYSEDTYVRQYVDQMYQDSSMLRNKIIELAGGNQ